MCSERLMFPKARITKYFIHFVATNVRQRKELTSNYATVQDDAYLTKNLVHGRME